MKLITTKTVREVDENGKTRTYNLKVINPKVIELAKLSQSDTILLHLLKIGAITPKTCEKGYGYMYCASIIRDLKEQYGARIEAIKQKSLNQFKQQTDHVEYHLQNPQDFKEILKNDNE